MSVGTAIGRTTGVIATELGEAHWRILYAIRTRGIRHCQRIGNYKMYDDEAVAQIKQALEAMSARRTTTD